MYGITKTSNTQGNARGETMVHVTIITIRYFPETYFHTIEYSNQIILDPISKCITISKWTVATKAGYSQSAVKLIYL